jgi:type II secretory pathway component PulJ
MNTTKSNHGYTLMELMMSVGLMSFTTLCLMSMMISALHATQYGSVQAQTDTDASIALQHMVSDVR